MAIVQAIIVAISRQAGKLLNTVFGWATVMLFGKVSKDKQIYLSMLSFVPVLWIALLVGIAVPRVGSLLLAFTLPAAKDAGWIRLIMIAAAALLPLAVGAIARTLIQSKNSLTRDLLLGYPYTIGLALTLLVMTVLAPVMKIREMAKRWTATHVPVIVEAADYLDVVGALEHSLAQNGFPTKRVAAPAMLRVPTKMLTFFAGSAFERFVADKLTMLAGKDFEVILHPSDLIVRGPEKTTPHIAAVATETLTFTKAHQTWSKEANGLEDRLLSVFGDIRYHEEGRGGFASAALKIRTIDRDLRRLDLVFDEWQILAREKLLVENRLLEALLGDERRMSA